MIEPTFYAVVFSASADEVVAGSLDEASEIAESLAPHGQRVVRVEGPDGCRMFGGAPATARLAA